MATKLNKIKLSIKQKNAAILLADPEFNGTITDLCKRVDVARTTFYSWLTNNEFTDHVDGLIDKYTDSELGSVWKALIRKCLLGDVQAIKLYFELKGKYKQNIAVAQTESGWFKA